MGCEHPKLHVLMVFIDFCPENPFKVQTLAEILADKEGGVFISRLDSKDAELCIEILDCVSHHLYMPPSPPQMVSSGHRGA